MIVLWGLFLLLVVAMSGCRNGFYWDSEAAGASECKLLRKNPEAHVVQTLLYM